MRPWFALLVPLLAGSGCTFYLGRAAASREPATVTGTEAATPTRPPSHDQQCSELRADIASSQHNQRSAAPTSQAPIIAAASAGKEDQRIEALQKRYAELGCVSAAAPEQPARGGPRAP